MADAVVRGRFVWHEVMTSDPKAASDFYGKVIGWSPQPWDKDPAYTVLTMGGRPMAGAMALPDEAKDTPPQWVTYIATPDVDATARHAAELGGTVLRKPAEIPDIGRFAMIGDPLGAMFAAFTPNQAPNVDEKPGLGDFYWHELVTTDVDAAWNFYQALFGWEKTGAMDMGPQGVYQMFGWKDDPFGGMFKSTNMLPSWLPYAVVQDAKSAVTSIEHAGGRVINGPMEVPGGDWIVQGTDPQGVMFAVHSRKQG